MILCLPCVILWTQPCFLLERVRKSDRSSNVDQEQVRKVSPVCKRVFAEVYDESNERQLCYRNCHDQCSFHETPNTEIIWIRGYS